MRRERHEGWGFVLSVSIVQVVYGSLVACAFAQIWYFGYALVTRYLMIYLQLNIKGNPFFGPRCNAWSLTWFLRTCWSIIDGLQPHFRPSNMVLGIFVDYSRITRGLPGDCYLFRRRCKKVVSVEGTMCEDVQNVTSVFPICSYVQLMNYNS